MSGDHVGGGVHGGGDITEFELAFGTPVVHWKYPWNMGIPPGSCYKYLAKIAPLRGKKHQT